MLHAKKRIFPSGRGLRILKKGSGCTPGMVVIISLEKSSFLVIIALPAPALHPLGMMRVFGPEAGGSRKTSGLRDEKNDVLRRP